MEKKDDKLICYFHLSSYIIEGNVNTLSIYENIIKNYNQIFNLNITENYSLNADSSNMKVLNLPCIYYEGKRIKREEIYFFFKKTLSIENNSLNIKDNIKEIEEQILENFIIYDFQELIDYINYIKKRNILGNIFRFFIQPINKFNQILTDQNIMKEIEKKFCINNKKEAIREILKLNNKINKFLNNYLEEKELLNHFDILIYSCIQTQRMFFKEKIKKYKLDIFNNIQKFMINMENKITGKIINMFEFNPQNYFIIDDIKENKLNINKNNIEDKKKDIKIPEENNYSYTNRLIPQAIGYTTLFTILFYLKKK
jgi:hypothetical protein